MSSATEIPIVPLNSPPTPDILTQIVTLHQDSITHDSALMRFHPPFTPSKTATMSTWWTTRLADLGRDKPAAHHIFLALSPPSPLLTAGAPSAEAQIVGIAELLTPASDTGHFRAEVEMLMVAPSFRNRGLARRLMETVEGCALTQGRTLLTLGTTRDSDADRFLYPRLGYKAWGTLPAYGEVPDGTGRRVDGVYYYKDLRRKEEER